MKKSTLFTTILAMLLGIVLGAWATPAFAVDGNTVELNLFELDGNPQDDSGYMTLPDDWELLWADCGDDSINDFPPAEGCGSSDVFTGIIEDAAPQTIFTGGGSKDINDISRTGPGDNSSVWLHEEGSVPDKDDITNGFAAAYQLDADGTEWCLDTDPDPAVIVACSDPDQDEPLHRQDDTIIYFGADRFDNNGDAFLGFWFFQENITLTSEKQQGGFKFSGNHQVGDILILVEYPQGSNAQPEIKVLEWNPAEADVANNLKLLITASDAQCDGTGGKLACADTNKEDDPSVPSLWDYTPKGGMLGDDYPFETFYSGGINITRLIGGGRCFSTFMAESRSSRSETAQLKGFVLSRFPLCSSSAVTEIHAADHSVIPLSSSVAVVGDTIHDSVLITGEILGGGIAPDPGVDVEPQVTDVTFTLYDNDSCDGNILDTSIGTLTGNGDGTSSAESGDFVLTMIGGHSYQATWAGDSNYPAGATSACEPFYVIQPKLEVVKLVNTCLVPKTDDSGTFDLLYKPSGGSLIAAPNGAGKKHFGTTGFFGVNPDTYEVDENMSNPGEYVKRFQPSGDCTGGSVTLAGNDQKTCFIENIRKPHLIVRKQIVGTPPDGGLFNLQINGMTVDDMNVLTDTTYVSGDGSDVGHGAEVRIRIDDGTLLGDPASFGNFTVGETAGTGTSLANYQTSILCDDSSLTQAVFASTAASPRASAAIPLNAGLVVTCTITNVAQPTANDCPVQ